MLSKPAPPPPKTANFKLADTVTDRSRRSFKQLPNYSLPMRSEYLPEWKARLRDCNYPEAVVVVDFEAYFDSEYAMTKDRWSTVEYIMDRRYENLGMSVLEMNQPFDDYEARTGWWSGEQGVRDALAYLKREYGENLERCTVVAQNAAFDMGVLSFRYGIVPPHFIDVLGLARHWNARTDNKLDTLAKRWGLPVKGDTKKFKEWTNRTRFKRQKSRKKGPKKPVQIPKITPEGERELAGYANNDVKREWELFTLLFPLMSNPWTELRVMQHTLELFLRPRLKVDPKKAEELTTAMEAEIDKAVEAAGITRQQASGNDS